MAIKNNSFLKVFSILVIAVCAAALIFSGIYLLGSNSGKVVGTQAQADQTESSPTQPVQAPTGQSQGSQNRINQEEPKDNCLEEYIGYLGVPREKLIQDLGEYNTIDEDGLEFVKYNIRVWFGDYSGNKVAGSILIGDPACDYNGARIGDDISRFKDAFGEPVSDNKLSAEAIFIYKGIEITVDYDPSSGQTVAVYVSGLLWSSYH